MTEQHPITPPEEFVDQWSREWFAAKVKHYRQEYFIAIEAARWGADQELEACCEWLDRNNQWARCDIEEVREGRRPKPLSLKKQALGALYAIATGADDTREFHQDLETIKHALEALPDD